MVVVRPQFQNIKKSRASGNKRGSAADVSSTRAAPPSSKNGATHVGPGGETPRRRRRRNPSEKMAAAAASKFDELCTDCLALFYNILYHSYLIFAFATVSHLFKSGGRCCSSHEGKEGEGG